MVPDRTQFGHNGAKLHVDQRFVTEHNSTVHDAYRSINGRSNLSDGRAAVDHRGAHVSELARRTG